MGTQDWDINLTGKYLVKTHYYPKYLVHSLINIPPPQKKNGQTGKYNFKEGSSRYDIKHWKVKLSKILTVAHTFASRVLPLF